MVVGPTMALPTMALPSGLICPSTPESAYSIIVFALNNVSLFHTYVGIENMINMTDQFINARKPFVATTLVPRTEISKVLLPAPIPPNRILNTKHDVLLCLPANNVFINNKFTEMKVRLTLPKASRDELSLDEPLLQKYYDSDAEKTIYKSHKKLDPCWHRASPPTSNPQRPSLFGSTQNQS